MVSSKVRLDKLLVDQGWAESRERAQRLIMAGVVWCEGRRLEKPGHTLPADSPLEVAQDPCPYVSRGGLKLAGALDRLPIDPTGRVCADIGASTGGFTECLLQRGAARVHAIDVGKNQLHERMRADPRVSAQEGVNARHLTTDSLPEPVSIVTIDVAFISLRLILPAIPTILAESAQVLALVKPQFEAGREFIRGGVVHDEGVHRDVLTRIADAAAQLEWNWAGSCPSPLRGPAGNREHFLLWNVGAPGSEPPPEWVADVVAEAFST